MELIGLMEHVNRFPIRESSTYKYHNILFADVYLYKNCVVSGRVQVMMSKWTSSCYIFYLN